MKLWPLRVGAFLFSQAVLPQLLKSTHLPYPPTLIFTGATASVKSSAMCSSFSCAKWSQRALSQSLAKEFGPQSIHVSHCIVDGVIDTEMTKQYNVGGGKPDAKLDPEAVCHSLFFPSVICLRPSDCRLLLESSHPAENLHDMGNRRTALC